MFRNVLLLITETKRKCTTKTFLVYDENGEENVVLMSVTLLHNTNTCLREKKKKKRFLFSTVTGKLTI